MCRPGHPPRCWVAGDGVADLPSQLPCHPFRRLVTALAKAGEASGTGLSDALASAFERRQAAQPQADGLDPGWCQKLWTYGPAAAGALCGDTREAPLAQPRSPEGGECVTLRLSHDMLSGSTGCHEWEAGFWLAEFVLNNTSLFQGGQGQCSGCDWAALPTWTGGLRFDRRLSPCACSRPDAAGPSPRTHLSPAPRGKNPTNTGARCLELGCGAGMVGVALAHAGVAAALCTDGSAAAAANCRANLALNGVEPPLVGTAVLTWGGEPQTPPGFHPDIVLGSDLLYDPGAIEPLLATVAALLRGAAAAAAPGRRPRDPRCALIATTKRNPETLAQFLRALEAHPRLHGEEVQAADRAGIRWHHVQSLEAARPRIVLHRITLT